MDNNILIIDDHPLIAKGLGYFLVHHGFNANGVSNVNDIFERVIREQPEFIILDIHMPNANGFDILKMFSSLEIKTHVIIFTGSLNPQYPAECEAAGASGFIHKSNPIEEFLDAIEIIRKGSKFFPSLINAEKTATGSVIKDFDHYIVDLLTEREVQTFRYLTQGLSGNEIARKMRLSNKTVSTYKQKIIAKLKARNLLDAIDIARRHYI